MMIDVRLGDCRDVIAELPDNSVDSIVTDPPYELAFMGKKWDSTGIAFDVKMWQECLRVLKPGGHLLAFGGSRTWHRLTAAIEDAGFDIRDSIAWLYGSGFPKSMDVSKAIDKAAGARREPAGIASAPNGKPGGYIGDRYTEKRQTAFGVVQDQPQRTLPATDAAKQWEGWGTALKPAFEPIVVARKPLGEKTVAANVLEHGTGALNIDACRTGDGSESTGPRSSSEASSSRRYADAGAVNIAATPGPRGGSPSGRWPTNVVLDESAAQALDEQTGDLKPGGAIAKGSKDAGSRNNEVYGVDDKDRGEWQPYSDSGGASRFFPIFKYQAKAPTKERPRVDGLSHATVKPLELMRWLIKLVTPPDGTVLDPFAGSGTTAEACVLESFRCIAIEKEPDYIPLIEQRLGRYVSR